MERLEYKTGSRAHGPGRGWGRDHSWMVVNSWLENSGSNRPPLAKIAPNNTVPPAKAVSHFRCCHNLKRRREAPPCHLPHRPTLVLLCKSDYAAALPQTFLHLQSIGLSVISCSWHSRPRMACSGLLSSCICLCFNQRSSSGKRVIRDTGTVHMNKTRCQSRWWD